MDAQERDAWLNGISDPPRYYNRLGVGISLREWGELREDPRYYRIGATTIGGRWWVSTVWMGIDHGFIGPRPIIFETMVFDHGPETHGLDRGHDWEMERYSTEAAARDGHERMVQLVMTLEGVTERIDD